VRLFPRRAASLRAPVGVAYGLFVTSSILHTSITVFVPLLMQQVYHLRPLHAGYFASLLAVGWTSASLMTARWHGAAERRAIIGGPLLILAMTGVLLGGLGHLAAPAVGVALTALGFGVGALSIHLIAFTMQHASPGEESITAGSIPTVRTLGIAFGSALAGVIATLAGLSAHVDAAWCSVPWARCTLRACWWLACRCCWPGACCVWRRWPVDRTEKTADRGGHAPGARACRSVVAACRPAPREQGTAPFPPRLLVRRL